MYETLWAVLGLAGALLMRAGLAVHHVGQVRAKNAASMTMRSLCDLCLAVLAFAALGLAITGAPNGIFGLQWRYLLGWDAPHPMVLIAGFAPVIVATGIVSGVLAERARFWPSLWSGALVSGLVVPVALLWAGRGWLHRIGFVDSAGAASIHWTGAVCALVGAAFVGARDGKYHRDGSATAIPGHSLPLSGLGALLLTVGWVLLFILYNDGHGIGNLLVAMGAGGMAALMLGQVRYYKPDVHLTIAGMIGAMVAISGVGGQTNLAGAALVGAVAGVAIPMALLTLDVRFHIDDPAGAIAIHGIGGAWGILAVPLAARGLSFVERLKTMGAQALGLAAIGALAVGLSIALWSLLGRTTKLRIGEAAEFDGLDLAEHDVASYPDFQQSMIKSYDLRQL